MRPRPRPLRGRFMVPIQGGSVLYVCTKFEVDSSFPSKVIRGVPNFAQPQTPFPGMRDSQNLISWSWSLPSPTDPEDRCTQFQVIVITDPQAHKHRHKHTPPQTGPITIHYAAKLSVQCNKSRTSSHLR